MSVLSINPKKIINDIINPKHLNINIERYNVDCKLLFDKNNNKNEFSGIEEMLNNSRLANNGKIDVLKDDNFIFNT